MSMLAFSNFLVLVIFMICFDYLYAVCGELLEVEGDALVIYLLVVLAINAYVLRVLGIESVGLCSHLDVLKFHVLGAVDDDALLGIVHL